jgi:hypothetical protein
VVEGSFLWSIHFFIVSAYVTLSFTYCSGCHRDRSCVTDEGIIDREVAKARADKVPTMNVPMFVVVVSGTESPFAKVASSCGAEASELVFLLCILEASAARRCAVCCSSGYKR